jgi:hypothetical protein
MGTVAPSGLMSFALTCGCTFPTVSVRCWRVSAGVVWNDTGLYIVSYQREYYYMQSWAYLVSAKYTQAKSDNLQSARIRTHSLMP